MGKMLGDPELRPAIVLGIDVFPALGRIFRQVLGKRLVSRETDRSKRVGAVCHPRNATIILARLFTRSF